MSETMETCRHCGRAYKANWTHRPFLCAVCSDPQGYRAFCASFDKAFRDVASWLPPNAAFRCEFVARVVAVKTAYGLWVSAEEKRAITDVLADC